VMPRANGPIARTGSGHLAELENRIVSRREPPVCWESRRPRIQQVSFNDVSQVVELLSAGAVGSYSLRLQ
jgi:hypothetical protein